MYPYVELFGIKLYMTGIGIVVACVVFLFTAYNLCKKYNQDFIKLFNWLPGLLILIYVLGLYINAFLATGNLIPTSLKVFSPYGYNFHLIGILLAIFIFMVVYLSSFRRNETKKIWLDIFFFSFINAIIAIGVFLILGDNFIGKQYTGFLSIRALTTESTLIKYNGVYPLGLSLSFGALLINVIISLWKMISKKIGLGLIGFILLFILLIILLPFWNYPAHGVVSFFGLITLDVNYYCLLFLILYSLLFWRKLNRPY